MARILGAIIISTVLFIPLIKTWKTEGIKGESEIIQKYMESSGMSRSDLQEFARQVMEPGTTDMAERGGVFSWRQRYRYYDSRLYLVPTVLVCA